MITPDQPYTQEELDRIKAMVAANMADPVYPISEDLSREMAEFRLTCEACRDFMEAAWAWLEKHGVKHVPHRRQAALPEEW